MPGWAKALIGTLCVVVALVIGALVVGIVYVARNKDATKGQIEPAKRVIAVTPSIRRNDSATAASRALIAVPNAILGLTPQALR
jgi:hypothetical protein